MTRRGRLPSQPNVLTRRGEAARALLPGSFHPFLRLAPELRNRVYQYHIAFHNISVPMSNPKSKTDPARKSPPAILLVNWQVYNEAKPFFYYLPLDFSYFEGMPNYLAIFGASELQRLRNVTVHVELSNRPRYQELDLFNSASILLGTWAESHHLVNLHIHCSYWSRDFANKLRRLRGIKHVHFSGVDMDPGTLKKLVGIMQSPKGTVEEIDEEEMKKNREARRVERLRQGKKARIYDD